MGKEAIKIDRDKMIVLYCIGMISVAVGIFAFRISLRYNAYLTYQRNHVDRVIKDASMSLEETQYYTQHPDEILNTDRYDEFYEIITNFYDYYSYGTIFVTRSGARLHSENYMAIKKNHTVENLFDLLTGDVDMNWFCSTFKCVKPEMSMENK